MGRVDKLMLLVVFLITILGVVFIYSATWDRDNSGITLNKFVMKQCLFVVIGFILLFIIMNADYMKMLDFAYLAYAINLAALLFLLIFGGERFGAKRWISLGPFSLQPSEFVKITVIFALAIFLGDRREKIGTVKNYFYSIGIVLPAFILIFLQPDLGTAFVLIPILLAVLFICGERVKYMAFTVLAGLASMPIFWSFLKSYQKNRLLVFLNPNIDPLGAGYTIIQSKIAIGSGGILGKGWLAGTQSHLKFLPERHTDFIFSVIGEEWGFVGGVILILLYTFVIMRGIRIINNTDDIYGRAIATGIVTLLAFQVLVNIAMTIGLMPVVGLPLPAISYGGSNTVTFLIAMGFLLNVGRRA